MAARFWRGTGDGNWGSTGNWSATSGGATGASVPTIADDVTFDASGNNNCTINASARSCLSLTITSGFTATITHSQVLTVAGNVTFGANYTIAGSSSMTISAASTITSNGKTWPNNMTWSGGDTKTLVGNLVIGGSISLPTSASLNKTTSETFTCSGINIAANLSGTADIYLVGGTWTNGGITNNNLFLQGNITVNSIVNYGTGTLKYISGTITTTSSTLQLNSSCTIDTTGMSWNNVSANSSVITVTLNSLLTASGTLTLQNTTFTGTTGFTVGTLTTLNFTNFTVTLKESITYTVTSSLSAFASRVGSILLFTSSHASNKAILTLQNGANCNCLASFTRIDASGGRPIRTFMGTITDCNNIERCDDLFTVASAA
jgi:hypothetical protein